MNTNQNTEGQNRRTEAIGKRRAVVSLGHQALGYTTTEQKDAVKRTARALADLVGDDLAPDHIVPEGFDPRITPAVARAVAQAARDTGVARL